MTGGSWCNCSFLGQSSRFGLFRRHTCVRYSWGWCFRCGARSSVLRCPWASGRNGCSPNLRFHVLRSYRLTLPAPVLCQRGRDCSGPVNLHIVCRRKCLPDIYGPAWSFCWFDLPCSAGCWSWMPLHLSEYIHKSLPLYLWFCVPPWHRISVCFRSGRGVWSSWRISGLFPWCLPVVRWVPSGRNLCSVSL